MFLSAYLPYADCVSLLWMFLVQCFWYNILFTYSSNQNVRTASCGCLTSIRLVKVVCNHASALLCMYKQSDALADMNNSSDMHRRVEIILQSKRNLTSILHIWLTSCFESFSFLKGFLWACSLTMKIRNNIHPSNLSLFLQPGSGFSLVTSISNFFSLRHQANSCQLLDPYLKVLSIPIVETTAYTNILLILHRCAHCLRMRQHFQHDFCPAFICLTHLCPSTHPGPPTEILSYRCFFYLHFISTLSISFLAWSNRFHWLARSAFIILSINFFQ